MDITSEDMATIDMDRIAERVVAAGFAAYVEMTGGGVATIFASRDWQDEPITRMGKPAGTIRRPRTHPDPVDADYPRCDVAAGPGWYEGPDYTMARAAGGDFAVGPDGDTDEDYAKGVTAQCEDDAVAAILRLLNA